MKTDELFFMLDKFTANTGKRPTRIVCGEEAFIKLRNEATDDWGAERYLEPNYRDGCVAMFEGIPIQVVHNTDAIDRDKIYIIGEPEEDLFNPIVNGNRWWVRRPTNNLIVDDIVDAQVIYDPKNMEYKIRHEDGFMAHYYGEWLYSNAVSENAKYGTAVATREEEVDISDTDLVDVLNGGGYNAVA